MIVPGLGLIQVRKRLSPETRDFASLHHIFGRG